MAKKVNRQPNTGNRQEPQRSAPVKQPVKGQPVQNSTLTPLQVNIMAAVGVTIATFLALKVCLDNKFTNWDDPGYVLNNPIIKDISWEGVKNIFSFSNPIMGNYHPLTILSYAIDYNAVKLEPYHYHLQSLLFHLATTLLVFCFVQLLTRRVIAASVTALFFGLHPMHIESVAWVAGRKDVVYGFFYMASCICYLYYTRTEGGKKWRWYIGTVALFVCSLLSKPVAVVLPVTLLLIDIFEDRLFKRENVEAQAVALSLTGRLKQLKFDKIAIIDKLPLFVISVAAGIKSMQDQQVFGALGTQGEKFNFLERLGLGGYALVTYLWKSLVPVKLLCFYPYPLKENGQLPFVYYIYPVIIIALFYVVWRFLRHNKAAMFGVLFFLVNIALLLQFIPVGGAIIADRYTYLPYIGLFFILGWLVSSFFEKGANRQYGQLWLGGVSMYACVLGFMSFERCQVWYDGMSLWRDEIEVEPVRAPNGYNNLGFFYFNKFNSEMDPVKRKLYYDSSFYLLNRAIELQTTFVNPYISIGELLRSNNQFPEAKKYYYKALTLNKEEQSANAYLGLAIIYSISYDAEQRKPIRDEAVLAQLKLNSDSAKYCYNQAFELKPYNPEAHSNYANFLDMTNNKEEAIKQYGVAVDQNPDIFQPYLNRGRALQRLNRCDEAFRDFNKALLIEPGMGEIFYARSQCYALKGDKASALKDVEKALSLGFKAIDAAYYQQLKR